MTIHKHNLVFHGRNPQKYVIAGKRGGGRTGYYWPANEALRNNDIMDNGEYFNFHSLATIKESNPKKTTIVRRIYDRMTSQGKIFVKELVSGDFTELAGMAAKARIARVLRDCKKNEDNYYRPMLADISMDEQDGCFY